MFCCRDAVKIMLYIAWGRQGLFIEGDLDVGEIPCRHLSPHIIEADLGTQRDAHIDGLKYT